ncbi:MAG: hypothetical protein ABL914_10960 [Novosphingobium sp.]|uniref:hypothetical protein n=1 Tax=Novosphingobium sp. TaxID=1874826 RepID=UPI0032BA36B7
MISNIRTAPLFLRPSVVRQLVGDIAAIRAAVVAVPLLPIVLVDRPRASEDPRLAKANDDIAALPVAPVETGVESGSDRVAPTDVSAPVVRIQAEEPEPSDWPDAPLPEHADPDLDRPEPDAEDFESATTCLSKVDRAGDAALAPEGTSGEVVCGGIDYPANASEQPNKSKECSCPPVKESGLDGLAARESVSPNQRALPDPLRNTPGEKRSSNTFDTMKSRSSAAPRSAPADQPTSATSSVSGSGFYSDAMAKRRAQQAGVGRARADRAALEARRIERRSQRAAGEADAIDEFQAALAKVRARRESGSEVILRQAQDERPKMDGAKLAEALRQRSQSVPARPKQAASLEPAPSREECPRCGIPGWKGCAHFLPCEDQPKALPEERYVGERKPQRFSGKCQGIGASRL